MPLSRSAQVVLTITPSSQQVLPPGFRSLLDPAQETAQELATGSSSYGPVLYVRSGLSNYVSPSLTGLALGDVIRAESTFTKARSSMHGRRQ